jgi:sortase A
MDKIQLLTSDSFYLAMKRLIVLLIFLILALGGISLGQQIGHDISQGRPSVSSSNHGLSPNQSQIGLQQPQVGIPEHITIPKINVDTTVEEVGLDSQGRMDVPSSSDTVGWYKLGYKPGEAGNAVLDGHLDRATGAPAIFWSIDSLGPGDKIIVTDSQGKQFTFTFVSMNKYPYNDFPIKDVFGSTDKSMINLITCKGTWDALNKNYSDRIVVTAELVK